MSVDDKMHPSYSRKREAGSATSSFRRTNSNSPDSEMSSGWSELHSSDYDGWSVEDMIESTDDENDLPSNSGRHSLITDVSVKRNSSAWYMPTSFGTPRRPRQEPEEAAYSDGRTGLTPSLKRSRLTEHPRSLTSVQNCVYSRSLDAIPPRSDPVQEPPLTRSVKSDSPRGTHESVPFPSDSQAPSTPIYDPSSPFNVPNMGMPRGSVQKLEFGIIAHDTSAQMLMDKYELAWGVQYEIARGVSSRQWTWNDVTVEKIMQLRGSNVKALEVPVVMLGRRLPESSASQKIWLELDREQKAIEENAGRGLGLHGLHGTDEWEGVKRWYGGKIQQTVELVDIDKKLQLRLAPMEMRKSSRFARYLGSRRMLSLNLPKNYDQAERFLRKKFILCGRVFLPFCVKDNGAYLMEICEDYERQPSEKSDQYRMSLQDFIEWHNPPSLNGNQAVSKWVARFDLGLSTSVPALRFEPENIFQEPDHNISGKVFTDGCGYLNVAALAWIARNLGYSQIPSAVQGRIMGSKGLWTVHPTEKGLEDPPKIWIRPSQVKVKLAPRWTKGHLSGLHPAHLIFDLVQPSRVSTPSRLSRYPIMNLSHNGVPTDKIASLMEASLKELVRPFTDWEGDHAMQLLWCVVYRSGNVTAKRLQRYAAGLGRVLGISRQFHTLPVNQDVFTEDSEEPEEEASPTDNNAQDDNAPVAPGSLHESALELIQAGFTPMNSSFLFEKVKQILQQTLNSFLEDYHIVLPESAEALIIPDPHGVLEEGQIYFRSSQPLKDATVNFDSHQLLGDVLLYRNPCRLPSDIQKATAVNHPALTDYLDVIVLPIKGKDPLASLLAGGDYDGDTAVCIYNPDLVQSFHPPPVEFLPQDFQEQNFLPQDRTFQVLSLSAELQMARSGEKEAILQDQLLSGYINNKIGKYSMYHDTAAYAYGLGDTKTVRLAHMFNIVLDSRKSGLQLRKDVFERDMRQFGRYTLPKCMNVGREGSAGNNNVPPARQLSYPFVLDELWKQAEDIKDKRLGEFDLLAASHSRKPDADLLRPWLNALETSGKLPIFKAELHRVQKQVEGCQAEWSRHSWADKNQDAATKKKAKPKDDVFRQRLLDDFRRPPDGVVLLNMLQLVDILKASYAYNLDSSKDVPNFSFSMAFRTLCRIKAESQGSIAFTKRFAETMSMPSAMVRVLSLQNQS